MKIYKTLKGLTAGTSLAAFMAVGACASAQTPNTSLDHEPLTDGYAATQPAGPDAACGEKDKKKGDKVKKGDAKCGEGSCGDKKGDKVKKGDAKCGEGSCGEGSCGEGSCGEKKGKKKAKKKGDKAKKGDATCGEGSCGEK